MVDHERRTWLDLVRRDPALVRAGFERADVGAYLRSPSLEGEI